MNGMSIFVLGPYASGKTMGFYTLNPKETMIITCGKDELPWIGWNKNYIKSKNYFNITSTMKLIKALDWIIEKKPKIRVLGIDDTSILTMEELNSKAKENGWEKYVNVGVFYHQLIKRIASITALGIHVIVTAHPRIVENESGIQTTDIRTGSKFADEKVSVLGMITCLFQTYREDEELLDEGEFPFRLQVKSNADYRSVRSPFGLFDEDNYTNSFQKIIDEIQLKLA